MNSLFKRPRLQSVKQALNPRQVAALLARELQAIDEKFSHRRQDRFRQEFEALVAQSGLSDQEIRMAIRGLPD